MIVTNDDALTEPSCHGKHLSAWHFPFQISMRQFEPLETCCIRVFILRWEICLSFGRQQLLFSKSQCRKIILLHLAQLRNIQDVTVTVFVDVKIKDVNGA